VAGRRLDGEPGGFEPADELADVLPHSFAPRREGEGTAERREATTAPKMRRSARIALNSRLSTQRLPPGVKAEVSSGVDLPRFRGVRLMLWS
jgi:hypothetical protein